MPEISRRTFGSALIAAAQTPIIKSAPNSPNVLFICSDEHGGPFLGSMGHQIVRTPNLDRLAASGVLFRNAYCGSPVCVPARAGMMSGMFPSDVSSYCNSTPFRQPAPSWGNRLRNAGYDCWASGKMDLTYGADYGFHEVDTQHGHSTNPDITSLLRSPMCFRAAVRADVNGAFAKARPHDENVLSNAIRFLREDTRRASKPWAIYLGFNSPHYPFLADPRYASMYPPESMPLPDVPIDYLDNRHAIFEQLAAFQRVSTPISPDRVRRARAAYFGMISEVDRMVGTLLDELEKTGQMERTLIIYTSDHGEMLGDNGLWFKNVLLENAARVPLIMAGPGMLHGRIVDTPVMHVDMVATILELAGVAHDSKLRGHSLTGLAQGRQSTHPGIAYCESHSEGNCTGSFMIRKGKWKYIYATGYDAILFDLQRDPGELQNLGGTRDAAAIQQELHTELLRIIPDPDAVTERAFATQQALLEKMVSAHTRPEFYEQLRSRLGPGQARILANQFYRERKG